MDKYSIISFKMSTYGKDQEEGSVYDFSLKLEPKKANEILKIIYNASLEG